MLGNLIGNIKRWFKSQAFKHSEFTFVGVFKGMPICMVFKCGTLVRYYIPKGGSFQDLKVWDRAVEGKEFKDLIEIIQREYE